jgi:hypothetical protein
VICVYHRIMAWICTAKRALGPVNRPLESVMHAVRAYGYHKVRAPSRSRFFDVILPPRRRQDGAEATGIRSRVVGG